jgi:hypothetical protein
MSSGAAQVTVAATIGALTTGVGCLPVADELASFGGPHWGPGSLGIPATSDALPSKADREPTAFAQRDISAPGVLRPERPGHRAVTHHDDLSCRLGACGQGR